MLCLHVASMTAPPSVCETRTLLLLLLQNTTKVASTFASTNCFQRYESINYTLQLSVSLAYSDHDACHIHPNQHRKSPSRVSSRGIQTISLYSPHCPARLPPGLHTDAALQRFKQLWGRPPKYYKSTLGLGLACREHNVLREKTVIVVHHHEPKRQIWTCLWQQQQITFDHFVILFPPLNQVA
jgi:hypothetical protein